MFNKQLYWKNRKQGKRGQGENLAGKFHPKGEDADYPNNLGSHMVKVGKSFNYVNRKEARRFEHTKDRAASHKNYRYQHDKNSFTHIVNQPDVRPTYPPSLTNHLRHRQRQVERTK